MHGAIAERQREGGDWRGAPAVLTLSPIPLPSRERGVRTELIALISRQEICYSYFADSIRILSVRRATAHERKDYKASTGRIVFSIAQADALDEVTCSNCFPLGLFSPRSSSQASCLP